VKPVKQGDRIVANIHQAAFEPWVFENDDPDQSSVLQLDKSRPNGVGLHIYKMEAGFTTTPHRHTSDETFLVLSGELIENDGTVYREGDFVLMKKGSEHSSYTRDGCVLAVYIETPEVPV